MTAEQLKHCPRCGKPLEKVTQSPNSMLNAEQFDAARLGDYFCDACPETGERYRYFWDRDLTQSSPHSAQTADTIDYYLPATRTKPAQQFTMRVVPDVQIAMLADQAGLPFGPDIFAAIKRFSLSLSAAAIAANAALESPALSDALDLYEAQTKALPFGHEIRERGYSAYNWQMAVIRDIRALLKECP